MGSGLHSQRVKQRCSGRGRGGAILGDLLWIQAPPIVDLLIILIRNQDEPHLPCHLFKLRVCLPRPQQRAGWQNLFGTRAARVRQAICDALHTPRCPYEDRLARVLVGVLPAHLNLLADERLQ